MFCFVAIFAIQWVYGNLRYAHNKWLCCSFASVCVKQVNYKQQQKLYSSVLCVVIVYIEIDGDRNGIVDASVMC